ncbi:MAG: SMI1/KNR4 family protein [Lachnospiraceae bacterium]|nr:SMI1/KNR4 family protein [Lachnospiraceae bacterium]
MQIEMKSKILPELNEQLIQREEKMWRIKLPSDYYQFLLRTNGGVPQKREFNFNNHKYMIVSFLCILENAEHSEFGFYDIDVVLSQIEERLTDNEDLVGCELLPIAELFAGDYICLDFKENKDNPSVCVWDHEESGELEPVTYKVADTFSEFVAMLM